LAQDEMPHPPRVDALLGHQVARSHSVGELVQAELAPGQWRDGFVAHVASEGLTIRYDDGSLQRGVDTSRVRARSSGAEVNLPSVVKTLTSNPEEEEEGEGSEDISTTSSVAPGPPLRPKKGPACRAFCFGAALSAACASDPRREDDEFMLEAADFSAPRPAALPPRAHAAELEAVLADAQRGGLPDREVARAREQLLALEAEGMRSHASLVVEEAIESGDFWQLQAAMQTAVSCGLAGEQMMRLKEAMRAPTSRVLRGEH